MDTGDFYITRFEQNLINLTQSQKNTQLMNAVEYNQTTKVDALLKAGANTEFVDRLGDTPLICAASEGYTDLVSLLIQAKANLESRDQDHSTALICAVYAGQAQAAQLLIEAGANLEAVNKDGNTALIYAALKGYVDCLALLVQAKANLEAVGRFGFTPVICAASHKNPNSLALLIQAKANLGAVNQFGSTALTTAIHHDHVENVHLLFGAITPEQLQQEINYHPTLDIQTHFQIFEQTVIGHRMNILKKIGILTLDKGVENPFSCLPLDIIKLITFNYCALGNKAWHAPQAKRDTQKICDVINKNGPLIFSSAEPNNKRKKVDELEKEGNSKKIKLFCEDDMQEDIQPKQNSTHTIS